jgi:hypothetical protein
MPKGTYLGDLEEIILLAVARCEPEAYGVRIRREIEDRPGAVTLDTRVLSMALTTTIAASLIAGLVPALRTASAHGEALHSGARSTFGGLTLIGVYGVVAGRVSESTRELGIRMALGAHAPAVMAEVLRRMVGVAAAGVLCGGAAAWGAVLALGGMLYGIGARDLSTMSRGRGAGARGGAPRRVRSRTPHPAARRD